jgi:hypothetical protein
MAKKQVTIRFIATFDSSLAIRSMNGSRSQPLPGIHNFISICVHSSLVILNILVLQGFLMVAVILKLISAKCGIPQIAILRRYPLRNMSAYSLGSGLSSTAFAAASISYSKRINSTSMLSFSVTVLSALMVKIT